MVNTSGRFLRTPSAKTYPNLLPLPYYLKFPNGHTTGCSQHGWITAPRAAWLQIIWLPVLGWDLFRHGLRGLRSAWFVSMQVLSIVPLFTQRTIRKHMFSYILILNTWDLMRHAHDTCCGDSDLISGHNHLKKPGRRHWRWIKTQGKTQESRVGKCVRNWQDPYSPKSRPSAGHVGCLQCLNRQKTPLRFVISPSSLGLHLHLQWKSKLPPNKYGPLKALFTTTNPYKCGFSNPPSITRTGSGMWVNTISLTERALKFYPIGSRTPRRDQIFYGQHSSKMPLLIHQYQLSVCLAIIYWLSHYFWWGDMHAHSCVAGENMESLRYTALVKSSFLVR